MVKLIRVVKKKKRKKNALFEHLSGVVNPKRPSEVKGNPLKVVEKVAKITENIESKLLLMKGKKTDAKTPYVSDTERTL